MDGRAKDVISREIIDEIVYRNDIEQVIGSYVTLKRAGSNLNGLCPFHSEKTPSFTVFPATKSFYCFGCGAGGDVITFTMRAENIGYADALELLAQKAGISIPRDASEEQTGPSRKRILEMNLAAAKFFRSCLFDKNIGAEAMKYLTEERRLDSATIRHFGIGFSPNDFGALTKHMHSLGFTDEELTVGFLCGKNQKTGRTYDYYRNRIIFPIIDTIGNVVAFGGRVMDDSKPKYLNTSDTPAFKKSKHLFALNFARAHAEEQMILCEGYMDVIALHAAGFENAVATLGTAITPDQARIFAKYTKKVIITYDSDNAGQTAADKAMRLLAEAGVDVRVLRLSGAKDPDEYIKRFGTDSFASVLRESKSSFDYKVDKILAAHDISQPQELIKASSEICSAIAGVYSGVEREIYISSAAKRLGITAESLKSDVERIRRRRIREYNQKQSQDAYIKIKNIGDRINPDSSKNIRANSAEEAVLGLMLIFAEYRADAASGKANISPDDFSTEFGKRVFLAICELERTEAGFSKAVLGQSFTVDEIGRIESMEQKRHALSTNTKEVFELSIKTLKDAKNAQSAENDVSAMFEKKRLEMKKLKESKK